MRGTGPRRASRAHGRAAALASLLLVAALGQCIPGPTPNGLWTLRSVNDSDLPAVVEQSGGTTVSIVRGSIFVRVEVCSIEIEYLTETTGEDDESETVQLPCTWEQDGGDVAFEWVGGFSQGTFDEELEVMRLTDHAGFIMVYHRI